MHSKIVICAGTLALTSVLSACGGPAVQPTENAAQSTSDTAAPSEPTPPLRKTATPNLAPIAVGQTGQAGGIALTVTDVTTPKQIGVVGAGPKAEAGETFLVVTYTLKNISARPLPSSDRPSLTLVDPRGQSYEPDRLASGLAAIHTEGAGSFSADLNPNVSAKDCAAWKLDANAFDRGTWRVMVATDPQLTFALK